MSGLVQAETLQSLRTAAHASAVTVEQVLQQRLQERRQRAAMAAERYRQECRREFEASWRNMVELAAKEGPPPPLTPAEIMRLETEQDLMQSVRGDVCRKYRVLIDWFAQRKAPRSTVKMHMARAEFVYLMRSVWKKSFRAIGDFMGISVPATRKLHEDYLQLQRAALGDGKPPSRAHDHKYYDLSKVIPAGEGV